MEAPFDRHHIHACGNHVVVLLWTSRPQVTGARQWVEMLAKDCTGHDKEPQVQRGMRHLLRLESPRECSFNRISSLLQTACTIAVLQSHSVERGEEERVQATHWLCVLVCASVIALP
jgi:hypothetical protein